MKQRVLMLGVHSSTRGGMWSAAKHYLNNNQLSQQYEICYIATACKGSKVRKLLFAAAALLRCTAELVKGASLVHIHMTSYASFFRKRVFVKTAKRFRKPVVIHWHGGSFTTFYNSLPPNRQKMVRQTLRQANRIICLGEFFRQALQSITEKPLPITVLHNAVPVPQQNLYNAASNEIIFLGTLTPNKGVYDIVQAVEAIAGQLPTGCKVVLYGEGETEKLAAEIKHRQLEKYIELRGWVDTAKAVPLFQNAMLNLLPSYHEGMPMAILEAMAYGVPSISTGVGAIPETITNGVNGVLLQPGDTNALAQNITALANNPAKRTQMSRQCHLRATEEFSLQQHMRRLMQIYQSVLQGTAI